MIKKSKVTISTATITSTGRGISCEPGLLFEVDVIGEIRVGTVVLVLIVDSIVVKVLMAPVVDPGRYGTVDMVSSVWSRVDTVVPPAGSVGVTV